MSNNKDNNLEVNEKVEVIKEDNIKEKNEIKENKSKIIDNQIDENPSFIKTLFATILDEAIILGVSAIGLVIFDILIGFMGYMVSDISGVLLIIFIIFNILYKSIFEIKKKRTIGKRILAIG